jgi:hypothetical protein
VHNSDPVVDAETVALVGRVCDEAWERIQADEVFASRRDAQEVRDKITCRVIAAAARGERDKQKLLALAYDAAQL